MQLISGLVDTYLRLSTEEEQRFRAELDKIALEEQEGVMQIVTSWLEEGRQQGLQQGESNLILRLLTRRVGSLSAELEAQIRELSVPQLEELGEALLDFSGSADLVAWLEHCQ